MMITTRILVHTPISTKYQARVERPMAYDYNNNNGIRLS